MSNITKPIVPGNSRIRDCERWIRENGFVVIPSNWDSNWVKKTLQQKIGPSVDIRDVKQSVLESGDYTHIHTLVADWVDVDD